MTESGMQQPGQTGGEDQPDQSLVDVQDEADDAGGKFEPLRVTKKKPSRVTKAKVDVTLELSVEEDEEDEEHPGPRRR